MIQRADEAALAKLEALWKDRADFPAKRQLARRRAGRFVAPDDLKDIGWANVPDGVRLIVSHQNVLCLARDDRHLYAGHPWGVAVYDLKGNPVTRIALAEAARALAARDGIVWAGTPKGLFKIERSNWKVAHAWLHGDVPPESRGERTSPGVGQYVHDNGVSNLVLDGDWLWISLCRTIHRLDLRTMTVRAFSPRELGIEHTESFERILPDGPCVWAAGRSAGLLRFDRAAETWQRVQYGTRPVGLIGLVGGRLFGHVWLGNELRDRPCLIDHKTLAVTPILIEGNLSKSDRCINGPFSYFGQYRGKAVFGHDHPAFVLDEGIMKLRPIGAPWDRPDDPIQSILPKGLRSGKLWWSDDPLAPPEKRTRDGGTLTVRQMDGHTWTLLDSPDGLRAVGKRLSTYTPDYSSPGRDWPFAPIVWDVKEDGGGLRFYRPDGTSRCISGVPRADAILGDNVFCTVPDVDHKRVWLCTNLGLAVLDEHDSVVATLTRDDGLCANRVTSGLAAGGRVYFSTAWGDHGGGLALFDPATHVLTAWFQSDGLATDKLARIEPEGDGLRLLYGVEYGRGGSYRYRLFPPGRFNLRTAQVTSGGGAQRLDDRQADQRIRAVHGSRGAAMPYLGGLQIGSYRDGEKTYSCGTRGLAVLRDHRTPGLRIEQLKLDFTTDPYIELRQKSYRVQVRIETAEDLARWAKDDNPYVRKKALEFARSRIRRKPGPFLPVLKQMAGDDYVPVRRLAVRLLGEHGDASAVKLLRGALEDKDREVRDRAALGLARLGHRPELALFEPILAAAYRQHGDAEDVYGALVPQADRQTFALFLKYPLHADDHEPRQAIFKQLAAALLEHPELADLLLAAYNPADDPGPESNYGRSRFAQEVFRHAGAKVLPRLHKALTSGDRVVRSNAARACGSIGDASSIPRLIKALDLESGLSRGSIVWALGQLKAQEALPQLATLYVDARNDEKRRRGAGFRMAQAQAQMQSHYETLGNLDAVAADWDELKAAARPAPVDPRRHDKLLAPETILKAVRKIGPASSQEFYRKLAAERDTGARREAAERLAEGRPEDAKKNIPILRNLAADEDHGVRAAALASLLVLGQKDVEKQILTVLRSPDRWEPMTMVVELDRVRDGRLLVFARAEIEKVAREAPRHSRARQVAPKLLQRMPKS